MTDAPERIWRVKPWTPDQVKHGLASWTTPDEAGEGATGYIREDLSPAAVTVKPLEWLQSDDGTWTAESPFGQYQVYFDSEYGWLCMIDGHDDSWVKYPHGSKCGFPDAHEGIGECERDYQSRMTPFVTLTPAPVAGNTDPMTIAKYDDELRKAQPDAVQEAQAEPDAQLKLDAALLALRDISHGKGMLGLDLAEDLEWAVRSADNALRALSGEGQ